MKINRRQSLTFTETIIKPGCILIKGGVERPRTEEVKEVTARHKKSGMTVPVTAYAGTMKDLTATNNYTIDISTGRIRAKKSESSYGENLTRIASRKDLGIKGNDFRVYTLNDKNNVTAENLDVRRTR